MTHPDCSIVRSLSVFSVAVSAVCMLGCAADVTPNGEGNDVSSVTQALTDRRQSVVIIYKDNRPGTSFQVGVETTDQSNGRFFGGTATVPGPMTNSSNNTDVMTWTQDGLAQSSYGQNASFLWIDDFSDPPHQFTTMRIKVTATINGSCHTDWENVTLVQPGVVFLRFDGHGASFNGTCWVGDLLKHCTPGVPC